MKLFCICLGVNLCVGVVKVMFCEHDLIQGFLIEEVNDICHGFILLLTFLTRHLLCNLAASTLGPIADQEDSEKYSSIWLGSFCPQNGLLINKHCRWEI